MTVLPLVAVALAKASVLLAVTAGVALLLRRSTASLRHLVWTLGLAGALVAPVLAAALPRWEVPLVTVPAPAVAPAALIEDAPAAPSLHRRSIDPAASAASATPAPLPTPQTHASIDGVLARIDWPSTLAFIWAIGAALILTRLLVGLIAVAWMARRLAAVSDAPWLPLARGLASDLGLDHVRFLQSRTATMPMAWGIVRPSIVVPADAHTWPVERLRMVLLHELAHVKRRDCLTHVVAQLACAAHWFNPLAWFAAQRLRIERERACDDLVLAAGTRGSEYADGLLHVARVMRAGRFPAVYAGASLAMAHRTQLEGRLIAILDPTIPRQGLTRGRAAIAAATFAMLLLPIASVQPWTEAAALAPPADGSEARLAPDVASAAQGKPDVVVKQKTKVKTDVKVHTRGLGHAIAKDVNEAVERSLAESLGPSIADSITGGLASSIASGITQDVIAAASALAGNAIAQAVPQAQPTGRRRGTTPDPRAVDALAAALKDPDKDVRETAMAALAQMRDPRVFDALVGALHDSSADVREKAVFGLGQLRDRRAIDPLTAALKDASPDVREQAAFALGQLRARDAVPALTIALKDEKANVREQAAFALGQLRDPSAAEPLISALKDESADVREQAAFALGQLRSERAVEALVIALKDANADVREQAAFALGQIRDPRAIDGLTAALKDASADVRQQAAFALGRMR